MRATIIADASVNERLRIGGWATWIKVDGIEAAMASGVFRVEVDNSFEAEAMAIANAITAAARNDMLDGVQRLMIQSDSLQVLIVLAKHIKGATVMDPLAGGSHIRRPKKPRWVRMTRRHPLVSESVKRIRALKEEFGFALELRHVKGHMHADPLATGAHRINALCDTEARTARRKEEKRRKEARRLEQKLAALPAPESAPAEPSYSLSAPEETEL